MQECRKCREQGSKAAVEHLLFGYSALFKTHIISFDGLEYISGIEKCTTRMDYFKINELHLVLLWTEPVYA